MVPGAKGEYPVPMPVASMRMKGLIFLLRIVDCGMRNLTPKSAIRIPKSLEPNGDSSFSQKRLDLADRILTVMEDGGRQNSARPPQDKSLIEVFQ